MYLLTVVSLVWAFSFGLIGNQLGGLSPAWLGWIRLALSALVFLPFVRRLPWKTALTLFATGAVQFGLMYLAYLSSFRYLKSHEVALFTVVTPLFVAGLNDLFGRRFQPWNLLAACLAVAGAGILKWSQIETPAPLYGILLVQASNLCFAAGQLLYRRVMRAPGAIRDHQAMAWMYAGGVMLCLPFLLAGHAQRTFAPTRGQIGVLLYLGVVASGIGFWLWNIGARRVRRAGTLAVMNNAKIPLGMAASLLFFTEAADLGRLLTAGAVLALAVGLCEWKAPA